MNVCGAPIIVTWSSSNKQSVDVLMDTSLPKWGANISLLRDIMHTICHLIDSTWRFCLDVFDCGMFDRVSEVFLGLARLFSWSIWWHRKLGEARHS